MRKTAFLSYNMTTADANDASGIVPISRQFDFIGDAVPLARWPSRASFPKKTSLPHRAQSDSTGFPRPLSPSIFLRSFRRPPVCCIRRANQSIDTWCMMIIHAYRVMDGEWNKRKRLRRKKREQRQGSPGACCFGWRFLGCVPWRRCRTCR